jgi:hypothetical protein
VDGVKWIVNGKEAKFTLSNNGKITASCEKMWQGIEFKNCPDFPFLEVNLGQNSEISHAYKAINFSLQDGNGKLIASGARLLHNYIGFESSQGSLNSSEIMACTLAVDQQELKIPFKNLPLSGKYRTGRFGIHLNKANPGADPLDNLEIGNNTLISNYFIGIQAYGTAFSLTNSTIEKIRFKGINMGVTNSIISNNQFLFERIESPIYNWMRYGILPLSSADQNGWPGNVSTSMPEYDNANDPQVPLGAYGICMCGGVATGNTFEADEDQYQFGFGCLTGVVAITASLEGNTFKNIDRGVVLLDRFGSGPVLESEIRQNTFFNNLTSIYLDKGLHNLNLRCNAFSQTSTIPTGEERIGLFIGQEASLFQNRIGGNGSTSPVGSPNSNYFPRSINPITQEIEPFPGYFSVWNESVNPVEYYKFDNEDLGNINSVNEMIQPQVTITRQNLENWCNTIPASTTQPNWQRSSSQTNGNVIFSDLSDCRNMDVGEIALLKSYGLIPNNWVLACEGGSLDNIAFPVTRPADPNLISEMAESLSKNKVYLGQSIPNPAKDKVSIPVLLSELKGKAILEIFEIGSGKRLAQKEITALGQHMVEFEVQSWAAGMYGYRLVLSDKKSPSPRKMVLVK